MKQLLIFLFVMTLPVSAGNEPVPEAEKDAVGYTESGQTLYKSAVEDIRIRGRRFGRNLGILGITASAVGVTVYHEYDKWSGIEISLIGVGVTAIGCYVAFSNRKKL